MAEPKHVLKPIGIEEEAGKKAYCTCGWSDRLPHCDGAHNRMDTGCKPVICELTEPGKKWVCQCHQTKTPPWCDGTHKVLREAAGE